MLYLKAGCSRAVLPSSLRLRRRVSLAGGSRGAAVCSISLLRVEKRLHQLHLACCQVQVRQCHALLCWLVCHPVAQEDLVAPHKGPVQQKSSVSEALMSTCSTQ